MSPSLTDQLFEQLQGAPLRQIAQQLGAGQAQTAGAVSAALPLLLGALGRNASQPQGADALYGALRNDFSGAGDLGGVLDVRVTDLVGLPVVRVTGQRRCACNVAGGDGRVRVHWSSPSTG